MTLCILAAGMGSRYGGLKQLDPMTENGEFIIDFTVFDAIRAGFDRVIFIIKKENYDLFRDTVGKRVEKYIKTEYAFQDINDIPEGFEVPEGRIKPWGTGHALLAVRDMVDDCFAVTNADDFYGREAMERLAQFLKNTKEDEMHFTLVGYILRNTLTKNGTTSRGICKFNDEGMLDSITERTKIKSVGDDAAYLDENDEWVDISGDLTVSMNCWGLTPAVFSYLSKGFEEFLAKPAADPQKSEFFLPTEIDRLMHLGICDVKVERTNSTWYGVTYPEDKEFVKSSIKKLMENGEYPNKLWN